MLCTIKQTSCFRSCLNKCLSDLGLYDLDNKLDYNFSLLETYHSKRILNMSICNFLTKNDSRFCKTVTELYFWSLLSEDGDDVFQLSVFIHRLKQTTIDHLISITGLNRSFFNRYFQGTD